MRTAIVTMLLLSLALSVCNASLLDRLSIHATGEVTVTVPVERPPQNPIFHAADGTWQLLEVTSTATSATFSVPPEAGGRTVILLHVPGWLVLEDETPPALASLSVEGRELEPAAEVDLGHWPQPPGAIRLEFRDEDNPVQADAASITLNGIPVDRESVQMIRGFSDRTQILTVDPGALDQGEYTLRVRIPDAAPLPNYAEVALRFSTGDLVKNGSFEQLAPDGTPEHWALSTWSRDETTEAQLGAVEGGRSGDYALELLGTAGSLNLVAGQSVPLSPERAYRVTGYYQASSSRGHLSLIAGGGEQYINSQGLPPVEEWTPFEWEFTTGPHSQFMLYLRNTGQGYVRFDDVSVEEARGE